MSSDTPGLCQASTCTGLYCWCVDPSLIELSVVGGVVGLVRGVVGLVGGVVELVRGVVGLVRVVVGLVRGVLGLF